MRAVFSSRALEANAESFEQIEGEEGSELKNGSVESVMEWAVRRGIGRGVSNE